MTKYNPATKNKILNILKLKAMQTHTNKTQPTIEDFQYENHDSGAAAIAAKKIAKGQIVSFDKWELVNIDFFAAGSRPSERRFVETVYIGIATDEGGTALRISQDPDLFAVGSHSLIPTYHPAEQFTDPVFIAAEITAYMYTQRHQSRCNFFLNKI